MFFRIKTLFIFLIAISLSWACNQNGKTKTSNEFTQSTSAGFSSDSENLSETNKIELKNRLSENLSYVEEKLEDLQEKTSEDIDDLDAQARATSEELQNDLKRLRQDLNNRLDNLQSESIASYEKVKVSANKGLEQLEDEMKQINEEIEEWFEVYTN